MSKKLDLDEDIDKKYDLRFKGAKAAAKQEQKERDQTRAHASGFKFAGWVGYIWIGYWLISGGKWITDGKLEFYEGLPLSDFAWWGWLLFAIFNLVGLFSVYELFTTYLEGTLLAIGSVVVLGLIIMGYLVYF